MNITVFATDNSEEVQNHILAEHKFIGSNSDFYIQILQKQSMSNIFRKASTTEVSYEVTEYGIEEKIIIADKITDQNLVIKFTDDDEYVQIEDDGSLVLFNNQNEMIGAVSNLNVVDANDKQLNVIPSKESNNKIYYEISDENTVYPLSATIAVYTIDDFSQWFSGGEWINRGGDISLSLTHTGWAYTGCSTGLITWSWNTVKDKFSSSYHWSNEQGMREQYQCHVNFATEKNPWNLEPWRPCVGIADTIASKCNP